MYNISKGVKLHRNNSYYKHNKSITNKNIENLPFITNHPICSSSLPTLSSHDYCCLQILFETLKNDVADV